MPAPSATDRHLMRITIALLLIGGVLMVAAWFLPTGVSLPVGTLGLGVIGIGAVVRGVVLVRRLWARAVGEAPEHPSVLDAPTDVCHECGYDLRGIEGPFCPECETVRPMRMDDALGG